VETKKGKNGNSKRTCTARAQRVLRRPKKKPAEENKDHRMEGVKELLILILSENKRRACLNRLDQLSGLETYDKEDCLVSSPPHK